MLSVYWATSEQYLGHMRCNIIVYIIAVNTVTMATTRGPTTWYYNCYYSNYNDNKKFELMLTRCAKAYSNPACKLSVCLQPFRHDFYGQQGYCSLMPSCAGFL